MRALSVRQPYAWLIVSGHKPIENRTWTTDYRGPLLIHAAGHMHLDSIDEIEDRYHVRIDRDELLRGGIIGRVELVRIVTKHSSAWFQGPFGWVFNKPRITKFRPMRGFQNLFNV